MSPFTRLALTQTELAALCTLAALVLATYAPPSRRLSSLVLAVTIGVYFLANLAITVASL